jgi:hypothetical protein
MYSKETNPDTRHLTPDSGDQGGCMRNAVYNDED